MKICVIGDCHFGVRQDSPVFHDYFSRFYTDIVLPYLDNNDIKMVIQTGDLFDRRKFVNFNTLYLCKKYFFDELQKRSITLITYLGNHDIFYKNTLSVNSPDLLLKDYTNITIVDQPKTFVFDDVAVDIIPWICEDNQQQIKDFITATKSQICFGHFELTGFQESRDHVCENGMNREDLDVYDIVVSGHFHHRSSDGHIFYVGSPCEHTWMDYNDSRGFHIFDTVTRDLEFIENSYHMFFKVVYDDKNETLESIENKNYELYRSAYIKVIIENKENVLLFERFIEKLYEVQPTELIIMEDFSQNIELAESDIINQADDTQTIIGKYIDSIESILDKNRLKGLVADLYKESLGMEL